MAGNEEGGVRTKVNAIPVILVLSLLTASSAVLFLSEQSDAAVQFDIEGGKTLFSPGEMLEADTDDGIYVVKYGPVYAAHSKITDSSGATVSSSTVSPADHTFIYQSSSTSERKGLGITAPDTAGEYTLVTEFELERGGKRVTKTYPIKVVDPILLTADVKNSSPDTDVKVSVRFIIDGNEMEMDAEHENISIEHDGTHTFTYEWITDGASAGRHTYSLMITSADMLSVDVASAEKELEFYVGQDDYTWLTVIFVIVLAILLIVLMWVIRKPVKNFGKPKGRR